MTDWNYDMDAAPKSALIDLGISFAKSDGPPTTYRMTDCRWRNESCSYTEGWHDAFGNHIEWIPDDDMPPEDVENYGPKVTAWMPLPSPPKGQSDE